MRSQSKTNPSEMRVRSRMSIARRHSILPPSNYYSMHVLEQMMEEGHTGDHFLTPEQLEVVHRTNIKTGLSEKQAAELLLHHGPNKLTQLHGTSYWKVLRHNLFGWFQCLLWIGAILNFVAYGLSESMPSAVAHKSKEYLYLGCIIVLTVLLTGFFGFYQEAKNIAVMSGFEKMIPANAHVIRDSTLKVKPNDELVVGDIVQLSGGQIVPADIRILRCSNFATDMSALTGESEPITHTPECTNKIAVESKNMVFFGCPAVQGTALGMVVATGQNTEMGKIAGLVTGLEKSQTPLEKEIVRFVKIICVVAFLFGAVFFVLIYLIQRNWIEAFQYMLGIILANVPEGLIVTLTVCKTLSARQLKKKNCLAKTLQAVEVLGSTSCICSDKTGTLTINRMSVSHLMCDFTIYTKDDNSAIADYPYHELTFVASLNLRAVFSSENKKVPIEQREIFGDASESAILRYTELKLSATKLREANPKVAEIPFDSSRKYQVTIHFVPEKRANYLTMKGAPEKIMSLCNTVAVPHGSIPLTPAVMKDLSNIFLKIANMGERLIGYASKYLSTDHYPQGFHFDTDALNFPLDHLTFLGVISLIDPPRPDIDKAIELCKEAGIKVIMVTGDHPMTALAISRQVGIITYPTAYDYAFENHIEVADVPHVVSSMFKAAVLTGEDLRHTTMEELTSQMKKYQEITFARTTPQQKLMIVECFQDLDHVVAVTGDGVNDAPALKKADIGIAMGITGTEVSKQAADMILLDDNFASIVLGIREGRRIFDNLKKTIAYTLTSNTPEMLPFVIYAVFSIPAPLTLMLILVINVGTDLMPAMSLAYEQPEGDVMHVPPRRPDEHLVTSVLIFMAYFQVGLIQFFAGMYAYFVVFARDGFYPGSLLFVRESWEDKSGTVRDSLNREWIYVDRVIIERKAQTAYFVAICLTQISDVIICKTRRVSLIKKGMTNHVLNVSIIVDMVAACLVTYVPIFNEVFGTEPLFILDMFLALPFMILMIFADELRRYIIRNNRSQWVEKETYY